MGWKLNADGSYDEWMNNDSIKRTFVRLYNMAKHLRQFIDSPMARNHKRLERASLNDPNFQRMLQHFMEDTNIHSWEDFGRQVEELSNDIQRDLMGCQYFKNAMAMVMKLKSIVEKERVISDFDPEDYGKWWRAQNFQNPFEGLKSDDLEDEEMEELFWKKVKKGVKKVNKGINTGKKVWNTANKIRNTLKNFKKEEELDEEFLI